MTLTAVTMLLTFAYPAVDQVDGSKAAQPTAVAPETAPTVSSTATRSSGKPAKPKLICRTVQVTGSISGKRYCLPKEQWEKSGL